MDYYKKPYYFLYTLPIALWGYFNELPNAVIIAEVLFSILCVYTDYNKKVKEISFITVYSAFTLIYCYGNYMVVSSIGTPEELLFDYYLVKENISEGLFFTYLSNVFCVLGFYYYTLYIKKPVGPFYPLKMELPYKWTHYLNYVLLAVNIFILTGSLNYILLFPSLISVLFFLTRYAINKDDQKLLNYCIANTFILSINGLLYDYLRMAMIAPCIALLVAVFFGKESITVFYKKSLYPIYGLLVAILIVFSFLGQLRTKVSGYEKINSVLIELNRSVLEENKTVIEEEEEEERFEARVSNINQTSQIVRVVDEDGFYHGETMAYLSYAFIPRFLWKEKPIIAQGVWFALRIGQAYVQEGVGANNSINMTSAGELYLNFGLLGVAIGMFLIGGLCAYMWQISGFSGNPANLLGGMFGLYLFFLATSTFGIDLQFIVTLVSYFCLFQFVNFAYIFFAKKDGGK